MVLVLLSRLTNQVHAASMKAQATGPGSSISLRHIAIFLGSLAVLAAATGLMSYFAIAEGAIMLASFPLAFGIAGTFYLGPAVAAALALVLFGAFGGFFGLTIAAAAVYSALYAIAVWAAAFALRRFGFGRLMREPVRALVVWYLVVGIALPLTTTVLGVPLLIAGSEADRGDLFVLLIADFVSDSFTPVSLGLALCAWAAVHQEKSSSNRLPEGERRNLEKAIWLTLSAAAIVIVAIFDGTWTDHGIDDMTPIFFLLLAWSALRFSLPFAMTATALVGIMVTSYHAFGLFGTSVPDTTHKAISIYANLLAITVLAQVSSAMTLQRTLDDERAVSAELDRAQLKRYFSPHIVEELLAQSESVDFTRSQRVVVMFADIVGFTGISQDQTPQETIALLREFDTEMEDEIFTNGGVVDKYIGDGVMAAFGLPETGRQDVASALRCARGMVERIDRLADKRRKQGLAPYRIGIGLHCGDVVAGNVGSDRNLSFTVIGDVVNTASRLEGLTRKFEAPIVVSEEVIEAVEKEAPHDRQSLLEGFEKVGETPVKGRSVTVDLWVLKS